MSSPGERVRRKAPAGAAAALDAQSHPPARPEASWEDDESGSRLAFWARLEGRWLVELSVADGGHLMVFDHTAGDRLVMDLPAADVPVRIPLTGVELAELQRFVETELGLRRPNVRAASMRSRARGGPWRADATVT